jgi:hypothetical protein
LIVGQKQFLNPIFKYIKKYTHNVTYSPSEVIDYSIINGYDLLLSDAASNLGWRVLAGCLISKRIFRPILQESHSGEPFISLLPRAFRLDHLRIIEKIRNNRFGKRDQRVFERVLGEYSISIINHYSRKEAEEQINDRSIPNILLSSFEGCKGLSAGRVFVVGLNEGIFPQYSSTGIIDDCDYRKIIVAMTRTKKLLFLLSNWFDYHPKNKKYRPSRILDWIPTQYYMDLGFIRAENISRLIATI